jgi:threonine/homoserine/homoserine lactone efflux protein
VESVIGQLLQGITLGFTATATPGPFQAFLLNNTILHGKKKALPLCLAPLISDPPIIVLMLCILTHMPQGFLRFIQIIGGLFLLYLAKGTISAVWKGNGRNSAPAQPRNFQQAIVMNLLSPGPYIFWGTITGPMFLKALSRSVFHAICFIGGFYATLIGGFMVFVIISSAALSLGQKTERIMAVVAGVALIGFGAWQIWNGIVT